jgi:SAM-dependent methyltransferase
LIDYDDRIAALLEAHRVLRPGGWLFAAAISRFASLHDGLVRGFLADPEFEAIVERDLAEGVHLNRSGHPGWFTTAYFHRPDEFVVEVEAAGFVVEALLAIEGPASLIDEAEWLADGQRQEVLLRAIRRVEAEPSLLGASSHLFAAARR